jgi:biotin operon repressor
MTSQAKYGSARKCRRNFRRKFRDEIVLSRQTTHNLVNKLRSTGFLIDKKQKHKRRVLTEEKLHTSRKSLKHLAQETGVSKYSARTATQLLKRSSESWCLVCLSARRNVVPVFFNETTNSKKISTCRWDGIFNTSCDLWIVNTSFQTSSTDSSAKFACASQPAAHRPLWSAEP